jgi:hypothetical protein
MSDTNGSGGHMKHWAAMSRPPATALKTIKGGRLQGMTDVNPQWRYQAMTEQFGPCGVGWKYEIDKLWTEPGCESEVLAFAQVSVRLKTESGWSEPIFGVGGNHLVVKESKGLRNNDECWKMAITDALSVALKMLGVAADIYAGLWDGAKYLTAPPVQMAPIQAPRVNRMLPPGTVQIMAVAVTQWGGEVTVVDTAGEEHVHKTTDRKLAELSEQIAQECVPVSLAFEEITRGKNKGKQKLTGVKRWVAPATPPPPEPEPVPPPLTADQIPF